MAANKYNNRCSIMFILQYRVRNNFAVNTVKQLCIFLENWICEKTSPTINSSETDVILGRHHIIFSLNTNFKKYYLTERYLSIEQRGNTDDFEKSVESMSFAILVSFVFCSISLAKYDNTVPN